MKIELLLIAYIETVRLMHLVIRFVQGGLPW